MVRGMIDTEGRLLKLIERQEDMIGNAATGRANTATLHVSPDGTGADGLSWRTAYTTLNLALDACSTDANDLTLVLMAPGTYDINATGIPSWAANVAIQGTHRMFTTITNTNGTQQAIMRLTGHSVVSDVRFDLVDNASPCNGLIMQGIGARVYRCYFDGSALATDPGISLMMNDTDYCKVIDCDFVGETTYNTALQVNGMPGGIFDKLRIHSCLNGIWILGADCDYNSFSNIDIGECAIGINIDAGSEQHFSNINFHHNTTNVDDEVCDHAWDNIKGDFPITIYPDNLTGITLAADVAANVWGTTTLIRAGALVALKPFRVLGVIGQPVVAQLHELRLREDIENIYFDHMMIESTRGVSSPAPSGTGYIFNCLTPISGGIKAASGGSD